MTTPNPPAKTPSALAQRVVTALVLAAIVLGVLATGHGGLWAALMGLFCVAAVWEGGRLTARNGQYNYGVPLLGLIWLGWLAYVYLRGEDGHGLHVPLAMSTAFWLAIAPFHLRRRSIAPDAPLLGALYLAILIGAAWSSVVVLRQWGASYLLAAVVVAVVADIAGYFFGRAFGKVKLAPAISPGKTREGAWGGMLCAGIWVALAAWYLGLANSGSGYLLAGLVGVLLGMVSIMGDLWESLLKRQAGVKDSSNLLPGHGGVLDRIDAQLAVLPIATLLILLAKPA